MIVIFSTRYDKELSVFVCNLNSLVQQWNVIIRCLVPNTPRKIMGWRFVCIQNSRLHNRMTSSLHTSEYQIRQLICWNFYNSAMIHFFQYNFLNIQEVVQCLRNNNILKFKIYLWNPVKRHATSLHQLHQWYLTGTGYKL